MLRSFQQYLAADLSAVKQDEIENLLLGILCLSRFGWLLLWLQLSFVHTQEKRPTNRFRYTSWERSTYFGSDSMCSTIRQSPISFHPSLHRSVIKRNPLSSLKSIILPHHNPHIYPRHQPHKHLHQHLHQHPYHNPDHNALLNIIHTFSLTIFLHTTVQTTIFLLNHLLYYSSTLCCILVHMEVLHLQSVPNTNISFAMEISKYFIFKEEEIKVEKDIKEY